MQIVQTITDNLDFQFLVKFLDAELFERYPETQDQFDDINKKIQDAIAVIGYVNNNPVCCGCVKIEDTIAELKRMFVKREHRGKGYSKNIVIELERICKQKNIEKIILETQIRQPEAISLYKNMGFKECDKFAPYIDNEMSICMEKNLTKASS